MSSTALNVKPNVWQVDSLPEILHTGSFILFIKRLQRLANSSKTNDFFLQALFFSAGVFTFNPTGAKVGCVQSATCLCSGSYVPLASERC